MMGMPLLSMGVPSTGSFFLAKRRLQQMHRSAIRLFDKIDFKNDYNFCSSSKQAG